MATKYSVQGTLINNIGATGFTPVNPGELGGRVKVAYFAYNFDATEVTSDVIRLLKVPDGARILAIYMGNEDCGTTVTADIGDTGDVDRLVTGYALGTAAAAFMTLRRDDTGTSENPTLGIGYQYTAETWIDITLTTVTTPTANATIRGYILYAVD